MTHRLLLSVDTSPLSPSALDPIADFAEATGGSAESMPEHISWDNGEWMSRPFVHARMHEGRASIRGLKTWFGGHVIRLPAGATDGIFAAWSADEQGVEIRNDRYGFYPLYYFSNDREFAASPFVLTLLALGASRELDDEGLAVFLRLGSFLRERTPFREIRALPPGCRLRWSRGALQVSGGMVPASRHDIDRSAAIDGFIDLFAQAVKRRTATSSRPIVPLSGGEDSRHILYELLRQGCTPQFCLTAHHFPPRPDSDVEVASQVAKAAGIPHVIVGQPKSPVRAESLKNLWTGLCTIEHVQFLPVVRTVVRRRGGAVFDGIGGDILTGLYATAERLSLFSNRRFDELVGTFLRERRETELAAILSPQTRARFNRTLAYDALLAELKRHADQPNPMGAFMFWNRCRRVVALTPYCLYSGPVEVITPYLDRDLYDFLVSLPGSMLENRQFHPDTIRRAYPQYAHLPFASGWGEGPPRKDRWFNRRFAAGVLAQTVLNGPSALIRRKYLAPRLVRRVWDGSNGLRSYNPELILYLFQLERAAAGGH
jgi:asparagine synthase (glutamine-hydrolysing)